MLHTLSILVVGGVGRGLSKACTNTVYYIHITNTSLLGGSLSGSNMQVTPGAHCVDAVLTCCQGCLPNPPSWRRYSTMSFSSCLMAKSRHVSPLWLTANFFSPNIGMRNFTSSRLPNLAAMCVGHSNHSVSAIWKHFISALQKLTTRTHHDSMHTHVATYM